MNKKYIAAFIEELQALHGQMSDDDEVMIVEPGYEDEPAGESIFAEDGKIFIIR